jgi:uncharacterized protein (DUF488 family)
MTVTLHTIGYQGRDPESFVAALLAAGVATLIDVRAVLHSRKPGFSKSQLVRSLQEASIAYLHLLALGNPPVGREAAKAGRREDYLRGMEGPNSTAKRARAICAMPPSMPPPRRAA